MIYWPDISAGRCISRPQAVIESLTFECMCECSIKWASHHCLQFEFSTQMHYLFHLLLYFFLSLRALNHYVILPTMLKETQPHNNAFTASQKATQQAHFLVTFMCLSDAQCTSVISPSVGRWMTHRVRLPRTTCPWSLSPSCKQANNQRSRAAHQASRRQRVQR